MSIAAAHLGAANVLALDTDPIAIEATVTNASHNAVSDHIHAGLYLVMIKQAGSSMIESLRSVCVLAGLAPDMAMALKPEALLISSGIIAEREDEVALAYAAAGLERIERRQEGDWVALVHRR